MPKSVAVNGPSRLDVLRSTVHPRDCKESGLFKGLQAGFSSGLKVFREKNVAVPDFVLRRESFDEEPGVFGGPIRGLVGNERFENL